MEKEFRRIPGFEKYIISNTGTVINTRTGTIRKQRTQNGYMAVGLFRKGKRRNFMVHRLVCQAFLPNSGFPQVNHKNGVKTDNSVENLEWCSAAHNNLHAYRVLNRAKAPFLLNGFERSRPCMVTRGLVTGNFRSINEAAIANKCPKHIFSRMIRGKKTNLSANFHIDYI